MADELRHECGVVALYGLSRSASKAGPASRAVRDGNVAALVPRMLLDLQNRGQLAAGISTYATGREQLLDTYKDVGTVMDVFRMTAPGKHQALMAPYAGSAAIGHTRYATCGRDDRRYAQPFERHHGRLWEWFSFAFNGNLANFPDLRDRLKKENDYHFALDTDTEILLHKLAHGLRADRPRSLKSLLASLSRAFDGAYNIAFLDAMGRMFVARDPLGMRPMCWAVQGRLFAAASESVALSNLGFQKIQSLEPGQAAIVEDGALRLERFAPARRRAHCFFEWIYFSNVASTLDGSGVYLARARSGQRLAEWEDQALDADCIVVPVPDTAKAAADAFGYHLGLPCIEGIIRNRYVGRTFIQSGETRGDNARRKYTPLPEVLKDKRVFLVEDSIVRSTTLSALVEQIRTVGRPREIHVRVACPPIVAPCFYGIDMSTLGELFAPKFAPRGYTGNPSAAMQARMAHTLGIESLRYLSVEDLAWCLQIDAGSLCTGCVTGKYPTPWGGKLIRTARRNHGRGKTGRTYE